MSAIPRMDGDPADAGLKILADASALLAESLEVEATLRNVARMMVPALGDWCAVEIGGDPATSRQLAVAHVDPEKVRLASELRARYPVNPASSSGVPHVLRTGTSELVADLPPGLLEEHARDPEHLALLRSLGLRSYVCVPLLSRGRTLGALTLVSAESGRRFDERTLALAEDLARRAAVALDNARLYEASREAEHRARESEDRLHLALEAGKLGTWEWHIQANRVVWSPAIERMHGLEPGSFDGTFEAYARDIHPDDRERVFAQVQTSLKSGEHHLLYRIVRTDGETRWLEAHGKLFRDEQGAPSLLRGVCSDVTERVAQEEKLRRAHEEIRARELRYSQILDSVPDMVFTKDRNLTVAYSNRAACQYYGMSADELRGVTDVPFNERDFTQKYLADDLAVFRTGKPVEDPAEPNRRHDGEVRLFHVVKAPIFDSDGRVSEIVGVARDVTDMRNAAARLRLAEDEVRAARHAALRAVVQETLSGSEPLPVVLQKCVETLTQRFEAIRVVIWERDPQSDRFTLAAWAGTPEPRVREQPITPGILGTVASSRSAFRTDRPHELPELVPLDLPRDARFFAALPLSNGEGVMGVLTLTRAEPVADALFSTLQICTDAIAMGVARRRTADALAEFSEELKRSNAELQQFAYVASHDLQEPLRMVSSYVQLLERRYQGKLDSDADEFIRYAVEGTKRMQTLINDLLAYSRVGSKASAFERVSVRAVLRESLDDLRTTLEQAGGEVTHDPLPWIQGDHGQIRQLFQNLIGNALKFRGAEAPRIHVSATTKGPFVEVAVSDNGIGVSPEFFDRVFVIFQRLHTRSEYPGNGIGLAICKKIVERHGGRIWIESGTGRGATFRFILPAAQPPDPEAKS